jgi:hypothetical protein
LVQLTPVADLTDVITSWVQKRPDMAAFRTRTVIMVGRRPLSQTRAVQLGDDGAKSLSLFSMIDRDGLALGESPEVGGQFVGRGQCRPIVEHRDDEDLSAEGGGDLVPDDVVGSIDAPLARGIRARLPLRADHGEQRRCVGEFTVDAFPPRLAGREVVVVEEELRPRK